MNINKVNIRPNIEVPELHYKDLALVSFYCCEGNLTQGNIAEKIAPEGSFDVPEGIILSANEEPQFDRKLPGSGNHY